MIERKKKWLWDQARPYTFTEEGGGGILLWGKNKRKEAQVERKWTWNRQGMKRKKTKKETIAKTTKKIFGCGPLCIGKKKKAPKSKRGGRGRNLSQGGGNEV